MERDELIDNLAAVIHPPERPDEAGDGVKAAQVRVARQRQEYALRLRAAVSGSGEDPLLAALRMAAAAAERAEDDVRRLIAYGRNCTGNRPDYTWERLAEAGGLTYSTARRLVSTDDIDSVKASLDSARHRWPAGMAHLDVHRTHAALLAFGFDAPRGLDADAEYQWWTGKAAQICADDEDLARQVREAADAWHTAWLTVIYPRGGHYQRLGAQLLDLADALHHTDPRERYVPDEAAQLAVLIEELRDLHTQITGEKR